MIGVIFNGKPLTDAFTVGNIKRPLPEFRPSMALVDGMDGEFFADQTVGTRRVSFDLVCSGASTQRELQDAARMLADMMLVRKPVPMVFSDELDPMGNLLVRYVLPTGQFDADEFKRLGKWHCEFVQPDPYLYGRSRSVVVKANQTLQVEAGGNAPAYPKATSTVQSGLYYQIGIDGAYVRYAGLFSGQSIEIDMEAQTAKPNPAIAGADGLQKGSRFFAIDGTVNLTATHQTTVSWVERWL